MTAASKIYKAATVVVVRERNQRLEVLLLKRNPEMSSDGGYWVFPGGKLCEQEQQLDIAAGSIGAAVRECQEECGLQLEPSSLKPFARWITPENMPRRFDTYFFITSCNEEKEVVVDQSEIVDYEWLQPAQAVERSQAGILLFRPPTLISLLEIDQHQTIQELFSSLPSFDQITNYIPKACPLPDSTAGISVRNQQPGPEHKGQSAAMGMAFLYQDDAGYAKADPSVLSYKHRITFSRGEISYYRNNERLL